jgi:hypothetical protein
MYYRHMSYGDQTGLCIAFYISRMMRLRLWVVRRMRRHAPSSSLYLIFVGILCTATIRTMLRKEAPLPKKVAKPTLLLAAEVRTTSAFPQRVVFSVVDEVAPPKIGVLIVADAKAQVSYARTIATARNYTDAHGYTLLVWDTDAIHSVNQEVCGEFKHLFFKRHCIARHFLQQSTYDILVALDADTAALTGARRIESLFATRPGIQLVHEERFHNGEVHAGSYAIRRGAFADRYLLEWARWEANLPTGFSNSDNGSLHMHLLRVLFGEKDPRVEECNAAWRVSFDLDSYDRFVGCAMRHIIFNANSTEIRLIRRGHGFCRDLWVTHGQTSDVDVFLHGIKERDSMAMRHLDTEAMKPVMALADVTARETRPLSLLSRARIDHCWPHCPEYW